MPCLTVLLAHTLTWFNMLRKPHLMHVFILIQYAKSCMYSDLHCPNLIL